MRELAHFFYGNNLIRHSKIRNIFTKYGIFQAKVYKDGRHEYLVMMSRNFFELEAPIVYLYSESHLCDASDDTICFCNHQIDIALKMLRKEGGVILYYSADVRNIDGLLQEIHARKLQENEDEMVKTKVKPLLKTDRREHRSIGFIFNNLNLSRIKLVTNDIDVVHVAQQLELEIVERASHITFAYGEDKR
ncbi:MAG: hypothetical protein U9O64_10735 [Campylobacterota bacterium]|nr:hypothetical protein [Campylobacterota bacterium]